MSTRRLPASLALTAILSLGTIASLWSMSASNKRAAPRPEFEEVPDTIVQTVRRFAMNSAPGGSRIELVIFLDFDCAACRRYKSTIDSLLVAESDRIQLYLVPFPISRSPTALERFAIAICANKRGRFDDAHAPLYSAEWGDHKSNVSRALGGTTDEDIEYVSRCAEAAETRAELEDGFQYARSLSIAGTPTVVLGPIRFQRPPSLDRMRSVIDSLSSQQR